jgi:hypothetical protein
MYKLIIDTREKKVSRHTAEFAGLNVSIGQITTGDYAIMRGDAIVAIFERKSLKDYGSSIRDGRHENKAKLLALRAKTGCRVFYIVEKRPDPNQSYGGVPWSTIRASIVRLMVRDGITVIYTDNTLHTARELRYMMEVMQECRDELCAFTVGPVLDDPPVEIESQQPLLFVRHDREDLCMARDMWAKFKGITVNSADEYCSRWSLYEALQGVTVGDFKLRDGKRPNKTVVKSLATPDAKTIISVFAEMPGVSVKTAPALANAFRIAPTLFEDVTKVGNLVISPPRKLGKKRAEVIVKMLKYKLVPLCGTLGPAVVAEDVAKNEPVMELGKDVAEDVPVSSNIVSVLIGEDNVPDKCVLVVPTDVAPVADAAPIVTPTPPVLPLPENDELDQFLKEETEPGPGVGSTALYNRYCDWCRARSIPKPKGPKIFAQEVEKRLGVERGKKKGISTFPGLKFRERYGEETPIL